MWTLDPADDSSLLDLTEWSGVAAALPLVTVPCALWTCYCRRRCQNRSGSHCFLLFLLRRNLDDRSSENIVAPWRRHALYRCTYGDEPHKLFLMKHEEKKKVRSIFILEGSTTILMFNTQKTGCVMHKKLLQHGNIWDVNIFLSTRITQNT